MPKILSFTLPYAAAIAVGAAALTAGATVSQAAELDVQISIKDHKFQPATVTVPAGKAVKLTVKNMDNEAEEFESHPLKFEKIIAPHDQAVIRLQPLSKGEYKFFGEYHEDTAQGKVVAE